MNQKPDPLMMQMLKDINTNLRGIRDALIEINRTQKAQMGIPTDEPVTEKK